MEGLKKNRKTVKSAITRIQTWVEGNLDICNDDILIDIKIQTLEANYAKYVDIQTQIESLDNDDNENVADVEEKYAFNLATLKRKFRILSKGSNASTTSIPTSVSYQSSGSKIKLPQISIPTFSGEYTKWVSFSQLFTTLIKQNEALSNVEKLIYLKGYVKGEPFALIEALEISNDGFNIAWDILESRYDNNIIIIDTHINKIIDFPNLQKGNFAQLQEFVCNLKSNLESLKNLNCQVENWDLILINIFLRKLDYNTKRYYQEHKQINILPTVDEFFKILGNRLMQLESMQVGQKTLNTGTNNRSVLHVNAISENESATKPCWYCSSTGHKIHFCTKFKNLVYTDKVNFVKSKSLCWNCLAGKHHAKECRGKRSCATCNRRHHTLLHQDNINSSSAHMASSSFQSGSVVNKDLNRVNLVNEHSANVKGDNGNSRSDNKGQITVSQEVDTSTTLMNSSNSSVSIRDKGSHVLLATAIVAVMDTKGVPIKVRAVLDNGSQNHL